MVLGAIVLGTIVLGAKALVRITRVAKARAASVRVVLVARASVAGVAPVGRTVRGVSVRLANVLGKTVLGMTVRKVLGPMVIALRATVRMPPVLARRILVESNRAASGPVPRRGVNSARVVRAPMAATVRSASMATGPASVGRAKAVAVGSRAAITARVTASVLPVRRLTALILSVLGKTVLGTNVLGAIVLVPSVPRATVFVARVPKGTVRMAVSSGSPERRPARQQPRPARCGSMALMRSRRR